MRHRSFYPRPSTVDDELRTLKITAAQRLTGFMGHRVNENLDRGFIGESVQFASAHIYIYIHFCFNRTLSLPSWGIKRAARMVEIVNNAKTPGGN